MVLTSSVDYWSFLSTIIACYQTRLQNHIIATRRSRIATNADEDKDKDKDEDEDEDEGETKGLPLILIYSATAGLSLAAMNLKLLHHHQGPS